MLGDDDFNTQSAKRWGFVIGILVAQISVFTAAVVGLFLLFSMMILLFRDLNCGAR